MAERFSRRDACWRNAVSRVAAVAGLLVGLVDGAKAGEIVMEMPEGMEWIMLPEQTMGPSYQREWIPTGSGPADVEWIITEQRLTLAEPKTAEEAMAAMQGLSRDGCTAVKFDGPDEVDTAIGQAVLGRIYCAQLLGQPYGVVTDQRIVVDGTTVFVVMSELRTPPSSVPGVFAFESEVESEVLEKRMVRSSEFVRKSVRIAEQRSESNRGVYVETPGNLAATNPLNCVGAETVSNTDTAADIASGARACVDTGDYDGMANLVLVANAFAYYDTLRVTDPSAHSALNALIAVRFEDISMAQRGRVGTAVEALVHDAPRVRALCAKLAALGPPDYRPTYMIAHGLGTVVGEQEGPPVRKIDRASGWQESLTYVKCPEL